MGAAAGAWAPAEASGRGAGTEAEGSSGADLHLDYFPFFRPLEDLWGCVAVEKGHFGRL